MTISLSLHLNTRKLFGSILSYYEYEYYEYKKHMIMFCAGMNFNNNIFLFLPISHRYNILSLSLLLEVVILPVRHLLVKLPSP